MSGIAIVVNRGGQPVPPAIVDAVSESIAHRGPDGIHTEIAGNAALVHARLAATPEATFERQPRRTPEGAWLVADLRLDNRDELIGLLGWDRPPATTADIDLFIEAYRRWGVGLVDRVLGDFAAAIVDENGVLTCIRDHLGIKPLYYWCSTDWIVVASGLREISAHPAAPRDLDVKMMGQYLSGRIEDSETTAVAGVKRLPAGNVMTIDDRVEGGVRVRRYWTLPTEDAIDARDLPEYAAEFRTTFIEAVRCRLRTSGQVACELSGGLDSTSVTAVSAQLVADQAVPATGLRAYSCLFPDSPLADERSYIDLVVDELGLAWQPIIDDPDRGPWVDDDVDFWSDIPLPPDGPDHVALARAAVDEGCKVVLTGQGGDDWFDPAAVALVALLDERRPAEAWRIAARWAGGARLPTLGALLKLGVLPHKPSWVHRPGSRRAPWVSGQARAATGLDRRPPSGRSARGGRSALAHWYEETLTNGHESMAKELTDRIAALGGVEARHPYMDRRLVELACRAPITAHVTGTDDRALQRAGLRGLIPDEIVERTSKATFNEVWFREIQRQLDGPIERSRPATVGWIDGEAAAEIWRATERRILAGSGGGHLFPLWGVVQVEALLAHFDGNTAGEARPGSP